MFVGSRRIETHHQWGDGVEQACAKLQACILRLERQSKKTGEPINTEVLENAVNTFIGACTLDAHADGGVHSDYVPEGEHVVNPANDPVYREDCFNEWACYVRVNMKDGTASAVFSAPDEDDDESEGVNFDVHWSKVPWKAQTLKLAPRRKKTTAKPKAAAGKASTALAAPHASN